MLPCSLTELTDSMSEAGFTVEQVYGDWEHGPFSHEYHQSTVFG
jgi:hypothetical protein